MYQIIRFRQQSNPIIDNFPKRSPKRRVFLGALALMSLAWQPIARAIPSSDTIFGTNTGDNITTGSGITAFGNFCVHQNTTGNNNTGVGYGALDVNVTGNDNTAVGNLSLLFSTASNNTAVGSNSLSDNTSGADNTATGFNALANNTTASRNTANGSQALNTNTTGANNTALGFKALFNNTTGFDNMATGALALFANTTGAYNMANGSNSLVHNTTGNYNVGLGLNALRLNETGNANTAIGHATLQNNTGGGNIAIGYTAGFNRTTGSNNIDIGNTGVAAESSTIRIGKVGTQQATYIAGISGKVVAGGTTVIIDASGHLGTTMSSARYKEQITPMAKASETIFGLKPVSFRYKEEFDPNGIPQFGLIAEDVAKVDPDLVVRDDQGKISTVRYEAVNAMLLNEFLKQHRKVEELEASTVQQQKDFQSAITQQQQEIVALTKALKEQAAQIQKVSAQVSLQKPGAHMIAATP